jgi:hypothetical protein
MNAAIPTSDVAEIHALATRAIIDREFQAAVLNGKRRERLQEFHLSELAVRKILAIQAASVQDFIHNLSALTGLANGSYR